jgi:GT2 family glycosyltransferase
MAEHLSIQIVSWNSAKKLPALFASLRKQSFRDFTVRVIDNASEDQGETVVREQDPSAVFIRNARNLGFSVAHNQGIRYAIDHWADESLEGKFILVLNDDIMLAPTCLQELMALAARHPEAASYGGKLLRAFGENVQDDVLKETVQSDVIDSTGIRAHKNRTFTDRGAGEMDHGQYDQEEEIFGVSGAMALYRAQALVAAQMEAEYFDADFFAYKEDVDLAWRLRLMGFSAWYTPTAVAYHDRGQYGKEAEGWWGKLRNRRTKSLIRSGYSTRNHLWLLLKNERVWNAFLAWPRIMLVEAGRFVYTFLFEPKNLARYAEALAGFPRMWRKRRWVMANRKVGCREIGRWFTV